MAQVLRQLGQNRPAGTSPVSIYSPAASTQTIIRTILICNTTGSAADFSIYHDDDGTTYDESTALYFAEQLAANTTREILVHILANDENGNIAVQTDTGNALTFTLYGYEET